MHRRSYSGALRYPAAKEAIPAEPFFAMAADLPSPPARRGDATTSESHLFLIEHPRWAREGARRGLPVRHSVRQGRRRKKRGGHSARLTVFSLTTFLSPMHTFSRSA